MIVTAIPATVPSHPTRGRLFRRRTQAWMFFCLIAASSILYGVNAAHSGFSDYYASAAKSMSVSWKAFLFGAFDPQSTITLDKLSGFLIPQALSARVFGFSAWSLAIPQAVEGVITVAAAYYVIRRWTGPTGGLIGAAAMAFTPLLVPMFSHPMEDGMLTMCTTLAVAAWQRSIETGRLRWLVLSGVAVGIGFQAKMMQAWLVLPALAVVYLLTVALPFRRKWWRLAVAGIVAVAVSLSWMCVIAVVSPANRPYIDGTTNNNIFSMVFGYNGVDRFFSNLMPGALGADPLAPAHGSNTVGLVPGLLGHTPIKLLLPAYASQIGWLYPLAAAGLVLGFIALRRTHAALEADERLRSGILLSGALLLTMVVVMSVMSLPHTAYLASMVFPLSALSAIGAILLWRTSRRRMSRLRFALPIATAVQTIWVVVLVAHYPVFGRWLLAPICMLGLGATVLLTVRAAGRPQLQRIARPAGAAALVATLLAPLTWALSTVVPAYAGTANDAYAGPPAQPAQTHQVEGKYGIGLNSNRDANRTATIEALIFDYAKANSPNDEFVLATDSWRSSAPLIMQGARRVLPIGGYSSRVDAPSLARIQSLVSHHRLTYILLTGPASKNAVSPPHIVELHHWVENSCRLVPRDAYAAGFGAVGGTMLADRLYACTR